MISVIVPVTLRNGATTLWVQSGERTGARPTPMPAPFTWTTAAVAAAPLVS